LDKLDSIGISAQEACFVLGLASGQERERRQRYEGSLKAGFHFAAPFFVDLFVGANLAVWAAVGADRAINTAKLVGSGSAALQPTSNRPKSHAAHFFSFPALSGSSVIVLYLCAAFL
jgi:hypothetical protein